MALTFAEQIHTCGAKTPVKDFYSVRLEQKTS